MTDREIDWGQLLYEFRCKFLRPNQLSGKLNIHPDDLHDLKLFDGNQSGKSDAGGFDYGRLLSDIDPNNITAMGIPIWDTDLVPPGVIVYTENDKIIAIINLDDGVIRREP